MSCSARAWELQGVVVKEERRAEAGADLEEVHNGGHVRLLVVSQAQILAVAEARAREIKSENADVFGQENGDNREGVEAAARVAVAVARWDAFNTRKRFHG
jgi:hypothetical protein